MAKRGWVWALCFVSAVSWGVACRTGQAPPGPAPGPGQADAGAWDTTTPRTLTYDLQVGDGTRQTPHQLALAFQGNSQVAIAVDGAGLGSGEAVFDEAAGQLVSLRLWRTAHRRPGVA